MTQPDTCYDGKYKGHYRNEWEGPQPCQKRCLTRLNGWVGISQAMGVRAGLDGCAESVPHIGGTKRFIWLEPRLKGRESQDTKPD